MNPDNLHCEHSCRNTCALLNDAMRQETAMIEFYEQMVEQCDYPDVEKFTREILEERSRTIIRMLQKLNELRARGQILDGVISSFNHLG